MYEEFRGRSPDELRSAVRTIDARLTALHRNGELDDEEQVTFDALMGERNAMRDALEQHDRIERAFRRGGRGATEKSLQFMRRTNPFDGSDALTAGDGEVRSKALAALETRFGTEHLSDDQRDHVDELIRSETDNCDGARISRRILLTEDPHYREAFRRLLTSTHPLLCAEEIRAVRRFEEFDRQETRGMSEGVTTAGGFGVPTFIDPTMILSGQEVENPYAQLADVQTITTNVWKGINTAGVSWSFDAEGAVVSDDSPTLGQPSATVFMARGFIPYTIEVGQDYPNLAEEMARILAGGYVDLEIAKLTAGNGTTEPRGILTALSANTNVRVTVTTSGTFAAVDLYKVWKALPIRFRSRAAWLSSTGVQNSVRNFGATFGSNFTEDLRARALENLFGRPYLLTDYLPDSTTSTTSTQAVLAVGAFDNFVIARRAGMRMEPVQHIFDTTTGRPTGTRGAFGWARVGSTTKTDLAFRLLVNTN